MKFGALEDGLEGWKPTRLTGVSLGPGDATQVTDTRRTPRQCAQRGGGLVGGRQRAQPRHLDGDSEALLSKGHIPGPQAVCQPRVPDTKRAKVTTGDSASDPSPLCPVAPGLYALWIHFVPPESRVPQQGCDPQRAIHGEGRPHHELLEHSCTPMVEAR